MNTTKTCPECAARLETARELFNKVREDINKGKLVRKNLVWLELTGCSGNIISLLDGSNPDFKYLILQNHIRHFYQYTIPDFVKLPDKFPLYVTEHNDFRLPKDKMMKWLDTILSPLTLAEAHMKC